MSSDRSSNLRPHRQPRGTLGHPAVPCCSMTVHQVNRRSTHSSLGVDLIGPPRGHTRRAPIGNREFDGRYGAPPPVSRKGHPHGGTCAGMVRICLLRFATQKFRVQIRSIASRSDAKSTPTEYRPYVRDCLACPTSNFTVDSGIPASSAFVMNVFLSV